MSQSAQAEIITCIPSNCQHLPNGKAIYSHHGLRSNHWANYKFTGRRFGEQDWKEVLQWRIRERDRQRGRGASFYLYYPSVFPLFSLLFVFLIHFSSPLTNHCHCFACLALIYQPFSLILACSCLFYFKTFIQRILPSPPSLSLLLFLAPSHTHTHTTQVEEATIK